MDRFGVITQTKRCQLSGIFHLFWFMRDFQRGKQYDKMGKKNGRRS